MRILTSVSEDEILLPRYVNWLTNFRCLPFNMEIAPSSLTHELFYEVMHRPMLLAAYSRLSNKDLAWAGVFAKSTTCKCGSFKWMLFAFVKFYCFLSCSSCVHNVIFHVKPPTKFTTPYGGRLEWTLPGGNLLMAHLKNKKLIRTKKRWSQVSGTHFLFPRKLLMASDVLFVFSLYFFVIYQEKFMSRYPKLITYIYNCIALCDDRRNDKSFNKQMH